MFPGLLSPALAAAPYVDVGAQNESSLWWILLVVLLMLGAIAIPALFLDPLPDKFRVVALAVWAGFTSVVAIVAMVDLIEANEWPVRAAEQVSAELGVEITPDEIRELSDRIEYVPAHDVPGPVATAADGREVPGLPVHVPESWTVAEIATASGDVLQATIGNTSRRGDQVMRIAKDGVELVAPSAGE